MRFILLIMLVTVLNADRLLIPLVSKHNTDTDRLNQEFNEFNYGIGYEYDYIDTDSYKIRFDSMILNDSYSHPMITATVGVDYKLTSWLSVGADFGLSVKKTLYVTQGTHGYFHRF